MSVIVFNPQDNLLDPISAQNGTYEDIIPQTGDYTVVLAREGTVWVEIVIPPL